MKRLNVRLTVISILLLINITFLFGAERYKWISIGSLQNFYHDTGCEYEEVAYPQQQWGFTWDAFYRDQDMQTAKGMWIGASNFYDPVTLTDYPYKVVHNGPRQVEGSDTTEFMPVEFKMLARRDHPEVYVNGSIASDMINGMYEKYDDIDEIDPALQVDRQIVNTVNTSMGITVTRNIFAISQQNYDDIIIHEYEFENTGIYDKSGNIYAQSLEDVYFQWQWQDAISQEGCWNGTYTHQHKHWISTSVRDVRWGYSMMYDVIGQDQNNPVTASSYEDHAGLDAMDNDGNWMRGYLSWMGKWDDFDYDNIGSPNVDGIAHSGLPALNDGRLGAAQYKGVVVIHADKSTSDHTDDLSQPKSNAYINRNSTHNFQAWLNQYDETSMTYKYQNYMANGKMGSFAADVWETENGDAGNYSMNTSACGYCQILSFGPYDMLPGEKIKIVYAECSNGLGHDYGYYIGQQWYKAMYEYQTLEVVDPEQPGSTITINRDNADAWKNAMVYSGRDSLMHTFRNAIELYKNGFYQSIAQAPPAPERFEIRSMKEGIKINWTATDAVASPAFDGFKIYRAIGAKDSVYEMVLDCSYSKDNINDFFINVVDAEFEFVDTLLMPDIDYYYYIVSYDDGTLNQIEPGKPLESSPFYTRTNRLVTFHYTDVALPSAGDGTKSNPYHIDSINNLYWIFLHPEECDKYYVQTQDIDASETREWVGGFGWDPIPEFSGVYDAQGYHIDSLYINREDGINNGLFCALINAEIRDLGLRHADINGDTYTGALAGSALSSDIDRCYSTGSVIGGNNTGGLIGMSVLTSLNDCYSRCSVNGGSSTGGLIGGNSSLVKNCYSTGPVSGLTNTGGLIGTNSGSVKQSFWDMQTSGQSHSAGGAGKTSAEMKDPLTYVDAGWDLSHIWTIEEGVNDGYPAIHVSMQDFPVDIIGIENISKNSADIFIDTTHHADVFGICWNNSGDPDTNDYKVDNSSGNMVQDSSGIYRIHIGSLSENTVYYIRPYIRDSVTVDYGNIHLFRTNIFTGTGTDESPYEVSSFDHLQWISDHPDDWDKHYIQTEDIDASSTVSMNDGKGWSPIGYLNNSLDALPFTGNYDGQDHVIAGLFIDNDAKDYLGLFAYTDSSEISNLTLDNLSVTGHNRIGGLIGMNTAGQISNCHCAATISGNNDVGGLIGRNVESTVYGCSFADSVNANDNTGGLIGSNSGSEINESYNSGAINGNYNVGGLVGLNANSQISNCYNIGPIDALVYVGGLIGKDDHSNIMNTYSTGKITGGRDLGGLIGSSSITIISNSFWDTESSEITRSSGGGIGKTTTLMKTENTFVNASWDFTDIWMIDPVYNSGYPILRCQDYEVGIDETIIPEVSLLNQNYPNPFNPVTRISFELSEESDVELIVFDVSGRHIMTLFEGSKCAGYHSIVMNASGLSSGVYLYRLKAGDFVDTRKMLLIK